MLTTELDLRPASAAKSSSRGNEIFFAGVTRHLEYSRCNVQSSSVRETALVQAPYAFVLAFEQA